MKICSKCKVKKVITDFYKDIYSKGGHSACCKICKKSDKYSLKKDYKEYIKDNPERGEDLDISTYKEYYSKSKSERSWTSFVRRITKPIIDEVLKKLGHPQCVIDNPEIEITDILLLKMQVKGFLKKEQNKKDNLSRIEKA